MIIKTAQRNFSRIAFIILVFLQAGCAPKTQSDLTKNSVIPKPVSVTATGDYFRLKSSSSIFVNGDDTSALQVGKFLADKLKPSTGFLLKVKSTNKQARTGIYLLLKKENKKPGDEGYKLIITPKLISLEAGTPAGLFMGVQTIRQLFTSKIELGSKQEGPWTIATGSITDYPEYSYRGMMLDVSRHFFAADDVKRLIDLISGYKINVLHLHLADDQGWRIEIKSWPNLAIHGGSTQVGGGKGGYYTQEQYKDIVKYAQERFITIVPEIDMPGHTNAALSSYAELNCDDKATELYTGTNVGFSSFCTKKEITYKFLDDVIGELAAMTPGAYIHIGGDESHSTKKEDYIPFITRVQDIVQSKGKIMIGWDDIAISDIKPGTLAQHWEKFENANLAVSKGAKIIMSPAIRAYIDMKYDDDTKLGLKWAGLIDIDKAYNWDPATLLPGVSGENIIGIEAPLWSETITNMKEMEFMVFPRLPGYAEIGWTAQSARSWEEYRVRLGNQGERLRALEINYYTSKLIPWNDGESLMVTN